MVDAHVSGTCGEIYGGSTPLSGTFVNFVTNVTEFTNLLVRVEP